MLVTHGKIFFTVHFMGEGINLRDFCLSLHTHTHIHTHTHAHTHTHTQSFIDSLTCTLSFYTEKQCNPLLNMIKSDPSPYKLVPFQMPPHSQVNYSPSMPNQTSQPPNQQQQQQQQQMFHGQQQQPQPPGQPPPMASPTPSQQQQQQTSASTSGSSSHQPLSPKQASPAVTGLADQSSDHVSVFIFCRIFEFACMCVCVCVSACVCELCV